METVEIIMGAQVTGTRRARHEEMTERTTKTTEIKTETREIEGELFGVKDEHTQVEIVEDNGGELAECVVTGASSRIASSRNEGREYAPLKRIATRWVRSRRAS